METLSYIEYARKKYSVRLSGIRVLISNIKPGFPGTYWHDSNLITVYNGFLNAIPFAILFLSLALPQLFYVILTAGSYLVAYSILNYLSIGAAVMHETIHAAIRERLSLLKRDSLGGEGIAEALCEHEASNAPVLPKYVRIANRLLHYLAPMVYFIKVERDRLCLQHLFRTIEEIGTNGRVPRSLTSTRERLKGSELTESEEELIMSLLEAELEFTNDPLSVSESPALIPEKLARLKGVRVPFHRAFGAGLRALVR